MNGTDELNRPVRPGAEPTANGVQFAVRAPGATSVCVCLFDDADRETGRTDLTIGPEDYFTGFIPGIGAGARYGFRADGPWAPEQGHLFDASKLLVDPFAVRIDRPFAYDSRLGTFGEDTATLVPKSVVEYKLPALNPARPQFQPSDLIYELPVRAFTLLHPDIPEADRGTLRALCHPAIIKHLASLHIGAVELMPIAAWIDERHLPPLGLTNAWGYNPVTMLALDPRLAPGGIADLRQAVDALHQAGISVFLDVVFNHTGESDADGPTLSMRGLGNATYYRHHRDDPGSLINDTGCGNTLACDRPEVQELVLASMRHFVTQAGIDGFRFDLAPILGRDPDGFSPGARLLQQIVDDPVLHDRVMIAEPWDIGPGGYQLGNFGPPWLEWNDQARDDIRRFWRGDAGMTGALATRLSGSSDIFARDSAVKTRSVNFVSAHDGFPLGDLVAYETKHNEANGEANRDGHDANYSWNNGVEGATDDPDILAAREAGAQALIATLFASRGTILLTAGDEFGHSQGGNNNAYAQDNPITWRNWEHINHQRLAFTRAWAKLRAESPLLERTHLLSDANGTDNPDQVAWLTAEGQPMTPAEWEDPARMAFMMALGPAGNRLLVLFNRGTQALSPNLPATTGCWSPAIPDLTRDENVPARTVMAWNETAPAS
ncbi:glycogen debranching protein GlgX [Hoeflea sp. Naph1]|uniref:glycogen debranching protein GlgX n=1 Tax=Hoeflea sp. Naph1 TaxID=3388653 RepID=UPI00398FAED8